MGRSLVLQVLDKYKCEPDDGTVEEKSEDHQKLLQFIPRGTWVFWCVWILFDLWKVQIINLRFYKTKWTPTDEFKTLRHTESKLELQLQLQLILRREYLRSLSETLVLKQYFIRWFTFECCVCSVYLHIEQKWKIKNIHASAVQLTQPRPALLTQNLLDWN